MTPSTKAILAAALATTLGGGWALAAAQPPRKPPPSVAWQETYGDPQLWHQFRAAAGAKGGEIAVASLAQIPPYDATPTERRLWLWRMDASGKVKAQTDLKSPAEAAVVRGTTLDPDVADVVLLANGDALLVVQPRPGEPWLVQVDRSGKQIAAKPVIGGPPAPSVFKTVVLAGGSYLLLGRGALHGVLMKAGGDGRVTWFTTLERDKQGLFVDGVALKDGGFIAVENAGDYDILRRGRSALWIQRYDARSKVAAQTVLKGRYGRVALAPDGGCAIVYDRESGDKQDIWVQRLSADLKGMWSKQVLAVDAGVSDFRIAALPDGGFMVAGGKSMKPYLARLAPNGEVTSSYWGETFDDSVTYDLVLSEAGYVLASSIYQIQKDGRVEQKLRLIQFADR